MNKEVDFLTECDTLLYWIYNSMPESYPDKVFIIEDIEAFCNHQNFRYPPSEIVDVLTFEQLLHAVQKTEENGVISVRMQLKGSTFCRAGHTLVSKYHADRNKKQGESAYASLTTKQDIDYESTKWWSKFSVVVSIISAIISLFALCNNDK